MGRYKADEKIKQLQNETICEYFDHFFEVEDVRALIIDTGKGLTVQALLQIGFEVKNITVVNFNEKDINLIVNKFPGINVYCGYFEAFVKFYEGPRFDLVYYDSCNILQTSYISFYLLFSRHLIDYNSIFAITLSSRQRTVADPDFLSAEYKVESWWEGLASDNNSVYYADQLVKDYASRFKYQCYRLTEKAQYNRTMFQIIYLFEQ